MKKNEKNMHHRQLKQQLDNYRAERHLKGKTSQSSKEIPHGSLVKIAQDGSMDDLIRYSEVLLQSSPLPLLLLDQTLHVKKASASFLKVFKISNIEGRSIYSLGNSEWNIMPLRMVLEEILPKRKVVSDYIITQTS